MPSKIIKTKPLPHIVICDANILWFNDKEPVANPDFEAFWDQATKEYQLHLHVPDTAWGELQFQHYASCLKQLRGIEESHKKISSIVGGQHTTRLTSNVLRAKILAKFVKWEKARKATILPLPVTKMDWQRLANDAIWRKEPFIADAKNPDSEKGFRDALIMETIVGFVESDQRQANIAFLCNDSVLRNATSERLKANKRFATYESLKDFEAYLRLTKEKLTNEFIAEIRLRAKDKFFSRDDASCLYFREKIRDRLLAEYKPYFDDVTKSSDIAMPMGGLYNFGLFGGSANEWTPANSGMYWIDHPEFLKIEVKKRYFWKSTVRYIRLYSRTVSTLLGGAGDAQLRVLILPFHVTWSAKVKDDARFYNLKVESIAMRENKFRMPTEDEIKAYNLAPESLQPSNPAT
jgi:hypothetical protein